MFLKRSRQSETAQVAPRPRQATIDEVAEGADVARRAREIAEIQQRKDLSLRLGERAMNGDKVGLKGFLAIGYPHLTPDDPDYKRLALACDRAKWIDPGAIVHIGDQYSGVIGIKADTPDKGVSFSVQPVGGVDGKTYYEAHANLLFTSALYVLGTNTAETATLHGEQGIEQALTDISFIESGLSYTRNIGIFTMREIMPHHQAGQQIDHYVASDDISFTGLYTGRLLALHGSEVAA